MSDNPIKRLIRHSQLSDEATEAARLELSRLLAKEKAWDELEKLLITTQADSVADLADPKCKNRCCKLTAQAFIGMILLEMSALSAPKESEKSNPHLMRCMKQGTAFTRRAASSPMCRK